jgi:hypothetical protein
LYRAGDSCTNCSGVAGAALASGVWDDIVKFAKEHPRRAAIDSMCGLATLVIDAEAHKKK